MAYGKYRRKIDAGRMARSVRWARELADATGYRYMVLRINGRYVVKPKRVWKSMCKRGGKHFKKGTTIQDLEDKAIFITK